MATTRMTTPPHDRGDHWITVASSVRDGRPIVIAADDPYGPAALMLQCIVGTPNTPSPTWVEHVVAGAPRIPEPVARRLFEAEWFKGRISLAKRHDFPSTSAIGVLGWRPGSRPGTHSWTETANAHIGFADLISRGALSSETLVTLADHPNPRLVTDLAAHPFTPPEALERIAQRGKVEFAEALCTRGELPPAVHETLALDPLPEVRFRYAAAHAWDADMAVLAAIARDRSPRAAAACALARPADFKSVARGRELHRDMLDTVRTLVHRADKRPFSTRRKVQAGNLTAAELIKFAGASDPVVRARAFRHPEAPPELVLQLIGDASVFVAASTARSAPPSVAALLVLKANATQTRTNASDADAMTVETALLRAVIDRPDLDQDMLMTMLGGEEAALMMASRPMLPDAVIEALSTHPSSRVRAVTARRSDLPQAAAARLLADADDDILLALIDGASKSVKAKAAVTRLTQAAVPTRVLAALMLRGDTSLGPAIVKALADDADQAVRATLALRPDLADFVGPSVRKRLRSILATASETADAAPSTDLPQPQPKRPRTIGPSYSPDPEALPEWIRSMANSSASELREALTALSLLRSRELTDLLATADNFPPDLQRVIAEVPKWVAVKGRFYTVRATAGSFDNVAEDRRKIRQAVAKAQRDLLKPFARMTPQARRAFLIHLSADVCADFLNACYESLSELELRTLRARPAEVAAIVGNHEAKLTPGNQGAIPSGVTQARVDTMTHAELLRYVSDQHTWPSHVDHVIQSRIIEPTNQLSNYKLVDLFDNMTQLAVAIASNQTALQHMSSQSIMELLAWNTGHQATRGWDWIESARQGDRWAVEEALARNKDVLPVEVVDAVRRSTNRRVQALLREPNEPERASIADAQHLATAARSEFTDGEFASLVTSADSEVLSAIVANDDLLRGATSEQILGMLQRADPRTARALAAKAADLPEEVQTAIAGCRFYVARRALAGLGPDVLCDAAIEALRADDDDGVAKIVQRWKQPRASDKSTRSTKQATSAERGVSQLLAVIADNNALANLTTDEQVALANHRSVDVPRALARKAPLLCPEAHVALAKSPIFTARRELVRTAGAQLDPALLEMLAADEDEVVRKIVNAIGKTK